MEEELSVRLTYFPITEQDTKDLYSVKATLQQVFYLGFWVNSDFHITLEEPLQFNYTANGNLEMLMALHMIQDMPEEDGEMMEELDIDFREE